MSGKSALAPLGKILRERIPVSYPYHQEYGGLQDSMLESGTSDEGSSLVSWTDNYNKGKFSIVLVSSAFGPALVPAKFLSMVIHTFY